MRNHVVTSGCPNLAYYVKITHWRALRGIFLLVDLRICRKFLTECKAISVRVDLTYNLNLSEGKLQISTFLAIKSLIFGAQKVITYRLKGN